MTQLVNLLFFARGCGEIDCFHAASAPGCSSRQLERLLYPGRAVRVFGTGSRLSRQIRTSEAIMPRGCAGSRLRLVSREYIGRTRTGAKQNVLLAYRNQMVRKIVGHDLGQKQVHSGERRRAQRLPPARTDGCYLLFCRALSQKRGVRGTHADPRRQPSFGDVRAAGLRRETFRRS